MRHLRARLALTTAAVVAAGLALSACGASSNPTVAASTPAGSASGAATSAVIGSADFSESQILAEVYAAALNAKGIKATTRPNIGSREVYLKAIQDGSVDIVPEYTGSLLNYLDKTATAKAPYEVYAALGKAVPTGLVALDKSAAEDKNSIVVTKDTAAKWSLTQIGDLVAHQAEIVVAAPPEFQTRVQGLPGLKDVYSFVPKDFRPLKGQAVVDALVNGQTQAANVFSTDPSILANGFVTLADPKALFGSDNVVPLVRKDKNSAALAAALNAASAKLDTATLTKLVSQVDVDKKDAVAVAKAWVASVGLG